MRGFSSWVEVPLTETLSLLGRSLLLGWISRRLAKPAGLSHAAGLTETAGLLAETAGLTKTPGLPKRTRLLAHRRSRPGGSRRPDHRPCRPGEYLAGIWAVDQTTTINRGVIHEVPILIGSLIIELVYAFLL